MATPAAVKPPVARPSRPIDIFRAELNSEGMRAQFARALPTGISVERFIRALETAVQLNPKVLQADRRSLWQAAVECAQLGFMPDRHLGEVFFTIFKGQVQLIPGYRGLVRLARQSGELAAIDCDIIGANDDVLIRLGDDPRFEVTPRDWQDRGECIGAFAICQFKDGMKQRVILNKAKIERARKQNPKSSEPTSPWQTDYDEMAKKTALRRLCKLLPLTPEAERAIARSELLDAGKPLDSPLDDIIDLDAEENEVGDAEGGVDADEGQKSLTDQTAGQQRLAGLADALTKQPAETK
jgi:recombination protein RecT